ncbi:MAG: superoxide dismutase [Candidatus Marinimicrobia bacterium]|nr:superoxide dismutase [Candidatus Neomarinimicrobiota bacterium]MDP7060771.1 superoxide dismutase [Candidatus Neomarinimicrobiota bacterium]
MSQPFSLPDLPFDENALAPTISAQTVGLHYGKHHAAYLNMLNTLSEGTDFADMELENVVKGSFGNTDTQKVFNNAGQAWNHILYWNQMQPGGSDEPTGRLASMIDGAFGDMDSFKDQFTTAAVGVFGSGWCWLVEEDGGLAIMGTPNAENPLAHGKHALMGVDVWEHAYYLDYQNLRADHVKAVLNNLINWDFVADRLS